MANFATDKGCGEGRTRWPMLGEDYGNGLGYYFTEAFKGLGGEIVFRDLPGRRQRFLRVPEQCDKGRLRCGLCALRDDLCVSDY